MYKKCPKKPVSSHSNHLLTLNVQWTMCHIPFQGLEVGGPNCSKPVRSSVVSLCDVKYPAIFGHNNLNACSLRVVAKWNGHWVEISTTLAKWMAVKKKTKNWCFRLSMVKKADSSPLSLSILQGSTFPHSSFDNCDQLQASSLASRLQIVSWSRQFVKNISEGKKNVF